VAGTKRRKSDAEVRPNSHMLPSRIFGQMLRPNFGPSLVPSEKTLPNKSKNIR